MGSAYSADDIARSKKPLELPKGARHVHVGSCYASNLRDPSFREGTDEPPSSTTVGFMQYLLFRLDSIPQHILRTSDLPSPQRLISYPSACAKINLNLRASLQVSGVTHWSRSEMILEEELLPLNLDRPPCLTSYQLPWPCYWHTPLMLTSCFFSWFVISWLCDGWSRCREHLLPSGDILLVLDCIHLL